MFAVPLEVQTPFALICVSTGARLTLKARACTPWVPWLPRGLKQFCARVLRCDAVAADMAGAVQSTLAPAEVSVALPVMKV